jgi:hypothetical protein
MDYMNKILLAKLPTVSLIDVKVGSRTNTYKDVDKFIFDLTENIR